jgi:nucleoid-associated protein YgaU
VVQKTDTLYSIARQFYGSGAGAGVDKIFEANKDKLPSKDQLKVGQTLVIP